MDTTQKAQRLTILSSLDDSSSHIFERLYKGILKRGFDLILFLILLPLALPLLLILMALIKIESKGPAIYKSQRIGREGKKFYCLKLRTMCVNADEKLQEILKNDVDLQREWKRDQKLKKDPRITRVGKFIRTFSLDEIPQIFNVFRGEMSFVGPRPIIESEISKYNDFNSGFNYYKRVLPGITGLWQVNGRNDISYQARIAMDSKYVETFNFPLDLKILAKTIPAALSQRGAY